MTDAVVLAFDFGMRRIGVAIGNTITRRARPLQVLDAGAARWAQIADLIEQWQPARLVVGIPRHPDGAPHEMTGRCERFARQLEGRYRRCVARVDERYSSAVVAGGADDAAATVILQQWLDSIHAEGDVNPLSPSRGGVGMGSATTPITPSPSPALPLEGGGGFRSRRRREKS